MDAALLSPAVQSVNLIVVEASLLLDGLNVLWLKLERGSGVAHADVVTGAGE